MEFKSITGYRELNNQNVMDLDGSDNTVVPGGAGKVNDSTLGALTAMYGEELALFGAMAEDSALIPILTPQYNEVQQSTAQMWQYIDEFGGAFYKSDDRIDYQQFSQELQMVGSADNVEYAVGLYYFSDEGQFRSTSLAAQPVAGVSAPNYDNETEAWALYGQTTIRPEMFEDKLALTLGYRYTDEKKDIKYLYQDAGYVLLPGPYDQTLRTNPDYTGELMPTTGQYNQKYNENFDNNSGTVTVAYDVADATTMYLRWGAELETQWLPTDNLLLSLSYSYMHGNFEEYAPLPGEDGSINTDDLAKRNSPDNMASGIVDWVFARTEWAEFIAHTEVFWQSKSYASPLTSGIYNGQPYVFPNTVVEDRTVVNLRVGLGGYSKYQVFIK